MCLKTFGGINLIGTPRTPTRPIGHRELSISSLCATFEEMDVQIQLNSLHQDVVYFLCVLQSDLHYYPNKVNSESPWA